MTGLKHRAMAVLYRVGGVRVLHLLGRILTPPSIRILYAHRVHAERDCHEPESEGYLTAARFERRIRYLARRYHVIGMGEAVSQLASGRVTRRDQAVITFDDGYADNLDACRMLKRYGLPATVYVTTGPLDDGRPLWFVAVRRAFEQTRADRVAFPWSAAALPLTTARERHVASAEAVAALKKMPPAARVDCTRDLFAAMGVDCADATCSKDRMLTWPEVGGLANEPLFTVGAHTVAHQILSAAPIEEAAREIEQSTADLQRALGTRPRTFAFPNGKAGDYLPDHASLLRSCGHTSACTTEPGVNCAGADLFALRRESLYGCEPFYIFALRMAGINEVGESLRAAGRAASTLVRGRGDRKRATLRDRVPGDTTSS